MQGRPLLALAHTIMLLMKILLDILFKTLNLELHLSLEIALIFRYLRGIDGSSESNESKPQPNVLTRSPWAGS